VVPRYETSPEAIELVLATYAQVFAHVAVWSVNQADIVLLGFRDEANARDLSRLEARVQQPDFHTALARIGIGDLPKLLVTNRSRSASCRSPRSTCPCTPLLPPRLSYEAGRGFFVGMGSALPFTGHGRPRRLARRTRCCCATSRAIRARSRSRSGWRFSLRACNLDCPVCGAWRPQWSAAVGRTS
jgi:hypothetical protein